MAKSLREKLKNDGIHMPNKLTVGGLKETLKQFTDDQQVVIFVKGPDSGDQTQIAIRSVEHTFEFPHPEDGRKLMCLCFSVTQEYFDCQAFVPKKS